MSENNRSTVHILAQKRSSQMPSLKFDNEKGTMCHMTKMVKTRVGTNDDADVGQLTVYICLRETVMRVYGSRPMDWMRRSISNYRRNKAMCVDDFVNEKPINSSQSVKQSFPEKTHSEKYHYDIKQKNFSLNLEYKFLIFNYIT